MCKCFVKSFLITIVDCCSPSCVKDIFTPSSFVQWLFACVLCCIVASVYLLMLGAYDDLTAAQSGGDFLKSPYGTSQTQPKGSANSKCSLIYSTTLNDVDLDWMQ